MAFKKLGAKIKQALDRKRNPVIVRSSVQAAAINNASGGYNDSNSVVSQTSFSSIGESHPQSGNTGIGGFLKKITGPKENRNGSSFGDIASGVINDVFDDVKLPTVKTENGIDSQTKQFLIIGALGIFAFLYFNKKR